MVRLTFGVSSSTYLASQVLRQIAKDHASDYPEAPSVVSTNFYVDDRLSGANTVEEALKLQQDLFSMLQKGGMLLRKWRSNSKEFLSAIPEEYREKEQLCPYLGNEN